MKASSPRLVRSTVCSATCSYGCLSWGRGPKSTCAHTTSSIGSQCSETSMEEGEGRSKSSVFRESAFVRQTKRPFLPPLLPCLSLPPFFRVPLLFFSRTFFREKGEKPSSFPLVSFHHHLSTLMRFSAVAAAPALPPSGGQGEATAFPLQFHEQ